MSKTFRYIYLGLSALIVLIVPQLIMDGEDGNLLVRTVMMAILALILYLIYRLIRYLSK